ncbi:amidohydrolase family protein [Isachenkonia alkalipeptolytica]|uniref:amidohydrolase family protein n=1 Tax=Isachenkonia alkalipeptolytica TaxID=2565777 RepID=UPI0013682B66
MNWNTIPKIDAHVHILPEENRRSFIKYQGQDCVWAKAELSQYIKHMDEYNIEKAILQPTNDAYMYFSARKTNEYLAEIVKKYPNRFLAFADISFNGSYILDEAPKELEYAIKQLGLSGLKIHPSNLNIDADDLRLIPVLRKAAELKVPVMYHANPCLTGFHDNCAPDKINKMIKIFPDIQFITAHMGGMKYLDALSGCKWVDISFILPEFIGLYGLEQTNRILRMFGADRLIFGTDYPEREYKVYCSILDKMDFTEEEKRKIAYGNIKLVLQIAK